MSESINFAMQEPRDATRMVVGIFRPHISAEVISVSRDRSATGRGKSRNVDKLRSRKCQVQDVVEEFKQNTREQA